MPASRSQDDNGVPVGQLSDGHRNMAKSRFSSIFMFRSIRGNGSNYFFFRKIRHAIAAVFFPLFLTCSSTPKMATNLITVLLSFFVRKQRERRMRGVFQCASYSDTNHSYCGWCFTRPAMHSFMSSSYSSTYFVQGALYRPSRCIHASARKSIPTS